MSNKNKTRPGRDGGGDDTYEGLDVMLGMGTGRTMGAESPRCGNSEGKKRR